jgi:SecD/SecF fusion protein
MSDYFDRVERQIVGRVEAGAAPPPRMPALFGRLGYAAAVLVVVVVVGAFLLARGPGSSRPAGPAAAGHGLSVSFTPQFLPEGSGASATISRTIQILRHRLRDAVPGAHVSWAGGHIVVRVSNPKHGARAQILALTAPGRLEFYDWEASVVTPNGKTVASQLKAQDPTALTISQGGPSATPGDPGAGGLSLENALALAAREPVSARAIVVGAIDQGSGYPADTQDPTGRYYVLLDSPALSGSDISNPQQSTDRNARVPDITFGFTSSGAKAFHTLSATVARRGELVSGLGQTLNQHFAIVLDNRLLTVPYIDYRQYPDGISGNEGADLTAGPTTQTAKDIAILLRYGPLPIALTPAG